MVRNGSCNHVSSSLTDSTQAGLCSHSHPCSQRIIHDCIQALPSRISVYRKQAGNSETMTSDPRGRHETATIRSDTWRQSAPLFICSTAIIQRRIEQDEHDPVQFCSSTIVDIADNNRKNQAKPCQHSTCDHWPQAEPETSAGLYDI